MLENLDERIQSHYQQIVEQLKLKKIRLTETRKAIILYLVKSQEHPSAEMIYQDLKKQFNTMSLATVYNNLNFLINEEIIIELKPSGATSYYDFLDHNHHHIICTNCGAIADFDYEDTRKMISDSIKQTGYRIMTEQIVIKGICPKCQP